MPHLLPTRRDFVQRSGILVGGTWLTLSLAACRDAARSARSADAEGEGPRVLTDDELATVSAIGDRILPPDGDAPGARALGVGSFADHFLSAHPDWLAGAREALTALPDRVQAEHAGAGDFVSLSNDEQDRVLAAVEREDPEHFGLLCILTVAGVLADPSRGGNRNKQGWAMIGFDDRHAWQPPFGYYDAQAREEAQGGDQ